MNGTKIYEDIRNINNLKELLDGSAKLYSNNVAFKVRDKKSGNLYNITYKEFKNKVDALGSFLIKNGFKGKKIAVISENRYEWGLVYFSVVNGTGIIVPLDRALPDGELHNLLERSEASIVFFSSKYIDKMKEVSKINKNIEMYVCMDDIEETENFKCLSNLLKEGRKLVKSKYKDFIKAKINNDDMSVLLFTSGTTGISKVVMLSHKNIATNLTDAAHLIKVYQNDVFFSFLPLHHTFECTAGFLFPIYVGSSIVYSEGLKYIAKNLEEFKPTIMITVPLIVENICKKVWNSIDKKGIGKKVRRTVKISNFFRKYFKLDLTKVLFKDVHKAFGGNMRLIIAGAAALSKNVNQDLENFGIRLMQGYGLTETSPIVSVGNDKENRIGACGKIMPSLEVNITDENEEKIGEIIVKGPSVMLGYYKNEEATKEVMEEGWFKTGDLGYFDKEGFLYVTGRKKDVIVQKNGKNIYPEELEILLNKIEEVKESFVYGKPTKDNDLDICAKIVYDVQKVENKFGKDFKIEDLNSYIKSEIKNINKTLPIYKGIRDFILTTEEISKTTTQKIKRFEELKKIEKES